MKVRIYTTNLISHAIYTAKMFCLVFCVHMLCNVNLLGRIRGVECMHITHENCVSNSYTQNYFGTTN